VKIYLAGPINACTDDEATGWRERFKSLLPPDVGYLDPMARDYRGRELEPGIAREIVEGDKEDIRNSNVAVFYYERPSVGTAMEMLFAYESGIPVVVIDRSGKPLSPWLIYHASRVTGTLNDAIAAALEVDAHPQKRPLTPPLALPPCHERGCKNIALADFVVCHEHVTKDALMLYANDLRAERLAAPRLAKEMEAVIRTFLKRYDELQPHLDGVFSFYAAHGMNWPCDLNWKDELDALRTIVDVPGLPETAKKEPKP